MTIAETLVLMAVLGLLFCILLPALAQAKAPARKSMCADNMRRLAEGTFSYANDHQGRGPVRGWFAYTVTEASSEAYGWGGSTKVLINLGMLHKTYTGGDPDRLYCPAHYTSFRDSSGSGWKTAFDPAVRFTHGGYYYALFSGPRLLASPRLDGTDPYPRALWSSSFLSFAQNWERTWGRPFVMPANPVLASDFVGSVSPGLNVLYLDGHVRYHEIGRGSPNTTDL